MQLPVPIHNLWIKYKAGLKETPTIVWVINIVILTVVGGKLFRYLLN